MTYELTNGIWECRQILAQTVSRAPTLQAALAPYRLLATAAYCKKLHAGRGRLSASAAWQHLPAL